MYRLSRLALFALVLSLTVAGCRKKPTVTPADTNTGPVTTPQSNPNTGGGTPTTTSSTPAVDPTAIERTKGMLLTPLYFEYDVAELSMVAKNNLDTKLEILRNNPDVRIKIEGHCDSRGSDEYNIALGQRRAAAAQEYLVSRGIAAGRIEIVSLGEERPADRGENEAAWSKNRRDEFVITAGAITRPLGDF